MGDLFGLVNNILDSVLGISSHNEDPFQEERIMNNTTMAASIEIANEMKQMNNEIRIRNPEFNPEEMLAYAKKVFELLINTRYTQNIDSIEHCLHNDLYQNICSEYNQLRAQNLLNFIKNVTVHQKQIKSYDIVDDNEVMTINIKARFMSYFITADTRQYVRGNRYDAKAYLAEMKFAKNKKYNKEAEKLPTNCPNCGAPLDEAYINVCSYCHTVVPLPKKEWLLISNDMRETAIEDMMKKF